MSRTQPRQQAPLRPLREDLREIFWLIVYPPWAERNQPPRVVSNRPPLVQTITFADSPLSTPSAQAGAADLRLHELRSLSPTSRGRLWNVSPAAETHCQESLPRSPHTPAVETGHKRRRQDTVEARDVKRLRQRDSSSGSPDSMFSEIVVNTDDYTSPSLEATPQFPDRMQSSSPNRSAGREEDYAREHLERQNRIQSTNHLLDPNDVSRFHPDVRPLVTHLLLRGREPILPSHWNQDFTFLPVELFASAPSAPARLSPLTTSDFRAQRTLSALFRLAPNARDAALVATSSRPAAPSIARAIQKHLAWSLRDAGLPKGHLPPLVAFYTVVTPTHGDWVRRNLAEKILQCHAHWRKFLLAEGKRDIPPPPVYGVIVRGGSIALLAWDPPRRMPWSDLLACVKQVEQETQGIGRFELKESGMDVWNAIAIALFAAHVRDRARELGLAHGVISDAEGEDNEGSDPEEP